MLMQDEWPLHMRALSSMIVRPCPTYERNGYPKSRMMLVTKSLGSSRVSCLCRPCSSSRSLTNLLRCIRGQVTLPLVDVDVRWMAIAYGSMKHDDCQRRRPTNEKKLLCHNALLEDLAIPFGVAQNKGLHAQWLLTIF